MKCFIVRDELSHYVEGALPGDAQAAIAQHLAACPACRAEAEAYQRAEEALRSLAAVVPAPDLTADLRQRLSTAAPPRPLRWVWAGAALAAVATAAAVLALRASAPPAPPKTVVRQPAVTTGRPRATEGPRQQLAIQPVTEETGVPRPTTPPHPLPAAVRERSTGHGDRARRLRHHVPPVALASATEGPPPLHEWRGGEQGEEAAPAVAVPIPGPRSPVPDGVVLLLATSQPALPAANCRVEVSLPDGSTSIREQVAAPDAAGEERVVRVTYQTTGPDGSPEWRPR